MSFNKTGKRRFTGVVCALALHALITAHVFAAASSAPVSLSAFKLAGALKTPAGTNLIANGMVSDPTVMFDNGRYRMWFTSVRNAYTSSQQMGVAYAESSDGLVWTPQVDSTGNPILLLSPTANGWDSGGVETPSVVKTPSGSYLLYYAGDLPPVGSNSWAIGLATSPDGLHWTKYGSGPILAGSGGWEGPMNVGGANYGGVGEPSVVYDAAHGLYRMWYSGMGLANGNVGFRMGYATSPDGVNWTPLSSPVLQPAFDGVWDDTVISHINVVQDPNGWYHLFYFGTSGAVYQQAQNMGAVMIPGQIGHATSVDGINWNKDTNPVLTTQPGTWQAWTIGGPSALIQNGQLYLWYFGSSVYNSYAFEMGLAKATI